MRKDIIFNVCGIDLENQGHVSVVTKTFQSFDVLSECVVVHVGVLMVEVIGKCEF